MVKNHWTVLSLFKTNVSRARRRSKKTQQLSHHCFVVLEGQSNLRIIIFHQSKYSEKQRKKKMEVGGEVDSHLYSQAVLCQRNSATHKNEVTKTSIIFGPYGTKTEAELSRDFLIFTFFCCCWCLHFNPYCVHFKFPPHRCGTASDAFYTFYITQWSLTRRRKK